MIGFVAGLIIFVDEVNYIEFGYLRSIDFRKLEIYHRTMINSVEFNDLFS
jgi:hypothetical protein